MKAAPERSTNRREEDEAAASESFGQWVALIVLLACWLAEASIGAG